LKTENDSAIKPYVMNKVLNRVHQFVYTKNQTAIALIIFVTCLIVYLANNRTITSNDNIPSSLLAFNWLENHTLDLDIFRNSAYYGTDCSQCLDTAPYFFAEAPNGHLTSTYPIGVSIITFPLYFVFFVWIKFWDLIQTILTGVPHPFPDITKQDFDSQRLFFEKIAAAISTALAVSIFYLSVRLKFSQAIALLSTFIYAFATSAWVSSAQGLRQHTISNLVVTSLIFCVLKVNASAGNCRRVLLVLTGILCGLLPGVRVSSFLFTVAVTLYIIFAYRKESIFLFLGFSSLLLNALWNFHYFGFGLSRFIVGGYSRMTTKGSFFEEYYHFTIERLAGGFLFLLANPNFGLLMFSPVLIFGVLAIAQVFQLRANRDEQFILCMTFAAFILFIQYCFFRNWTGGNSSNGPRYMTDLLPVITYLTAYSIAYWFESSHQKNTVLRLSVCGIFLACLMFSTFVQTVGVFGRTPWGIVPIPLNDVRVWDWQDTQIQRHWNSLYFKFAQPIDDKKKYGKAFSGQIQQITTPNQQPISSNLVVFPARKMILRAELKNTGISQWYGYETGMETGVALVRASFLQGSGEQVKTANRGKLFVSGMPKAGDSAIAVGSIVFPRKPGQYQLVFDMAVQGMEKFVNESTRFSQVVQVEVKEKA
jgi:hypothetical protein